MENLQIYNATRAVPAEAKKTISAGRLKGYTDINPMWRIKVLTEQFGPCGIGWKAPIRKQWLEPGAEGTVMAFCNIELFIKVDGQWSEGIDGTGGAAAVASERNGLYTDDECFKKAYTDAISVACKMLGFGADVYWEKDSTKYSERNTAAAGQNPSTVASDGPPPFNKGGFEETSELPSGNSGTTQRAPRQAVKYNVAGGGDETTENDQRSFSGTTQRAPRQAVKYNVVRQSPEMLNAVGEKAKALAAMTGKRVEDVKMEACNAMKVNGFNDEELGLIIGWMDKQMEAGGTVDEVIV